MIVWIHQELVETRNKTIPQVILRWHYQLGAIAIPKSASPKRQRENMAIFDFSLTEKEMTAINELTQPNGRRDEHDPAIYEEF